MVGTVHYPSSYRIATTPSSLRFAVVLLIASSAMSAIVHAQQPNDPAETAAMNSDSAGIQTQADFVEAYNSGVQAYRKQRFDVAEQYFRAARANDSDSLAAKAHFNLGNAIFRQAIAKEATVDVDRLRSSIQSYRRCLAIDRDFQDARYNLEAAIKLIEQQEQQEQQPSENPQSEQSKDEQSKDEQSSEEQNKDKQQKQQQQDTQEKEEDGKKGKESEPGDSKDGEPEQDEPADNEPKDDEPGDKDREQERQQEPSSKGQPEKDPANDVSDSPTENSDTLSDQDSEMEPLSELDELDQDAITQNDPPDEMTQQEAEKLLQAIRDRDLLRRLRLEANRRSRRIRVSRDW